MHCNRCSDTGVLSTGDNFFDITYCDCVTGLEKNHAGFIGRFLQADHPSEADIHGEHSQDDVFAEDVPSS